MSTTTTNLGLVKPALTDPADITLMNENWDKIDERLLDKKIKTLTSSDDLDTIVESGYYIWSVLDKPKNAPPDQLNKMRVSNYGTNSCCQELINIDSSTALGNCIMHRVISGISIGTWEWVNPPMMVSVEYRTTERYNDKAVYVKRDFDGIVYKRTEDGLDITPITCGTDDLTVGSALPTGQLYFVYE